MSVSLPLAMTSPRSKCLQCSAGWCQGRESLADMLKRTRGRNWTTICFLVSMPGMKSTHFRKDADMSRAAMGNTQMKTHRHGHTCKYHLWAARTKKFLKGHPGYWARLQGSYTPTVICEQKTLAESHTGSV